MIIYYLFCLSLLFFGEISCREIEELSDLYLVKKQLKSLKIELEESGIKSLKHEVERLTQENNKLNSKINEMQKNAERNDTSDIIPSSGNEMENLKEEIKFLSGRLQLMENEVQRLVVENEMSPDWTQTAEFQQLPHMRKHYASLLKIAIQNFVPRSCKEWELLGATKSGEYLIDPDGIGKEEAFEVFCDLTAGQDVSTHGILCSMTVFIWFLGYTFIQHNIVEEQAVPSCIGKGCHSVKIQYNATEKQIKALKKNSNICKQYIKMSCQESPMYNMWWVGSDGLEHYDWAGATSDYTCLCGYAYSCINPSKKCNCDAGLAGEWLFDSGYVANKSALPITQIVFGNPDKPLQMKYTVGPLQCFGNGQESFSRNYPQTCYDLKLSGISQSGYQYVGEPDHPALVHCDMSKSPPKQTVIKQQTPNFNYHTFLNKVEEKTQLIGKKYDLLDEKIRQLTNTQGTTVESQPTENVLFNAVSRDINQFNQISIIVFDYVTLNIGNGYNSRSGQFVAPYAGVYAFSFHGNTRQGKGLHGAFIRRNGEEVARTHCQGNGFSDTTLGMSVLIALDIGDTVDVIVRHGSFSGTGPHLVFAGFKVM